LPDRTPAGGLKFTDRFQFSEHGETTSKVIARIKRDRAEELLGAGACSVSEAAQQPGFSDPTAFGVHSENRSYYDFDLRQAASGNRPVVRKRAHCRAHCLSDLFARQFYRRHEHPKAVGLTSTGH
jgi:AraC-like DNA-binding protein